MTIKRPAPVILSEAKDLGLSCKEEKQILRRFARAVAIAALARRRPQDDRAEAQELTIDD
jgi:hypothetical protein